MDISRKLLTLSVVSIMGLSLSTHLMAMEEEDSSKGGNTSTHKQESSGKHKHHKHHHSKHHRHQKERAKFQVPLTKEKEEIDDLLTPRSSSSSSSTSSTALGPRDPEKRASRSGQSARFSPPSVLTFAQLSQIFQGGIDALVKTNTKTPKGLTSTDKIGPMTTIVSENGEELMVAHKHNESTIRPRLELLEKYPSAKAGLSNLTTRSSSTAGANAGSSAGFDSFLCEYTLYDEKTEQPIKMKLNANDSAEKEVKIQLSITRKKVK